MADKADVKGVTPLTSGIEALSVHGKHDVISGQGLPPPVTKSAEVQDLGNPSLTEAVEALNVHHEHEIT